MTELDFVYGFITGKILKECRLWKYPGFWSWVEI
jgi:hypothetical protein